MTKQEMIELVKRRLGFPVVKVEIDDRQILDHIDYTLKKWKKWAVGNATQEIYFTLLLSGGQSIYDLPLGVTDVIAYDTGAFASGINTLFTIENYFYTQGMFDGLLTTKNPYSLVDYHISRDFLDTVKRYVVDEYSFYYHRYTNQLEIQPPPTTGANFVINNVSYDSPGWILIRSIMVEGSTLSGYTVEGGNENFLDEYWVLDYVTALTKITLGRILRKFSGFNSLGNVGIDMDGNDLVSEGKEEIESLEEKLRLEEAYEGYGISIG